MNRIAHVAGVVAVLILASIAWLVLGGVMTGRTLQQDEALRGRVAGLWGRPQAQRAPTVGLEWTVMRPVERVEDDGKRKVRITGEIAEPHREVLSPTSTDLHVVVHADPRRKGLIWYSLYDLHFRGAWRFENRKDFAGMLRIEFAFPDAEGLYDGFRFAVNGTDVARELRPENGKVGTLVPVKPGDEVLLEIAYATRGLDEWRYQPGEGVTNLENFRAEMEADFAGIDFPGGTLSPSSRERTAEGWKLGWTFAQVVTADDVGLLTPQRIQPGQLAAELAYSAPISLLFFVLLVAVRTMLRGIHVHPVNYLFVAAAFFAFHLLFAYLADHVAVEIAFAIASAVSVALVVSYLRLVVSMRFALIEALSQLVFLVGFSLAHFWKGYTGLTVTVLSILTLFVLMQMTGRIRWSDPRQPVTEPRSQTP